MQQKLRAPPSSSSELIFKSPLHADLASVPFSWEEKPGVPKTQESSLFVNCVHFPAVPLCMQHHQCPAISPLRKPPRLQPDFGPLVGKTPSFNSVSTAPRLSSRFLLRRQSFDNVSYGDDIYPLTKEHSQQSFILHQSWNARGQSGTLIRMEDDPFFMAIQACTKDPIEVFYHPRERSTSKVCEEESRAGGRKSSRRVHGVEDGFKHVTVQQLFSRQSREEEHLQKTAQTQPQGGEGKGQGNGLLSFVGRCFGCF